MSGLSGLLHLVAIAAKFRPQAEQEKGSIWQPTSSPPPLGHGEFIQVWLRLRAAAAPGEDSDESASRH